MNIEKYRIQHIEDGFKFQFESKGPKGSIAKVVIFDLLENDVYNLAFGDLDLKTDEISDMSVSNNGDRQKVLSTVAECVQIFLLMNPTCSVFAIGSTLSRTRLYQIAINKFYDEISSSYEILGFFEGKWQVFEPNGSYNAFLIRNLEANGN